MGLLQAIQQWFSLENLSIGRNQLEGIGQYIAQPGEILFAGFDFAVEPILEELVQLDDFCFDVQKVERVYVSGLGHFIVETSEVFQTSDVWMMDLRIQVTARPIQKAECSPLASFRIIALDPFTTADRNGQDRDVFVDALGDRK